MSDYDTPRRERLLAEVRARLQTDLGPETRDLFERALEAIPKDSPLYLGALEETLATPPERLERELRNTRRNSGISWSRPTLNPPK